MEKSPIDKVSDHTPLVDLGMLGRLNIARSGELFMYCVWIQGMMVYLLILSRDEKLKAQFIMSPTILPDAFVKERTEWLNKPFSKILSEFHAEFDGIINFKESIQLKLLNELRDMLAHCHISIGRRYVLWGPRNSFEERIKAFGLKPDPELKHNLILFDGSDDTVYLKCFSIIKKLDEGLIKRVAEHLGIHHGSIR